MFYAHIKTVLWLIIDTFDLFSFQIYYHWTFKCFVVVFDLIEVRCRWFTVSVAFGKHSIWIGVRCFRKSLSISNWQRLKFSFPCMCERWACFLLKRTMRKSKKTAKATLKHTRKYRKAQPKHKYIQYYKRKGQKYFCVAATKKKHRLWNLKNCEYSNA